MVGDWSNVMDVWKYKDEASPDDNDLFDCVVNNGPLANRLGITREDSGQKRHTKKGRRKAKGGAKGFFAGLSS